MPKILSLLRWLLAPATAEPPRFQAGAATALRLVAGLLWLLNVGWKSAPDFGKNNDGGLYHYTAYAVSNPVFPPYSFVVEHLVLPHFTPFGWGVLVAETALGVMLLSGSFVRVAAAVGVLQSLAIGLSVAYAPGEWPWSYLLMMALHGVLLFSSGGRVLAVDAVRAGLTDGRMLTRVWGVACVVVGAVTAIASLGDPLAARGAGFELAKLQVGFGNYNLIGGLVLTGVGVLLLVVFPRGGRRAALAAGVLGVAAALSLHVQLGFSSPVLGGTPTSASFFLAAAVVGFAVAWASVHAGRRSAPTSSRLSSTGAGQ